MRRFAWSTLVLACACGLGFACGSTTIVEQQPSPAPGADGGTPAKSGGTSGQTDDDDTKTDDDDDQIGPTDAGTDAAPPEVCDGPCPPAVLASNLHQATALTLDAQNIYFAVEGSATGNVFQCPKTGCVGDPIALGPGYAYGIAIIGSNAIWGDFFTGKLWSCAIGGCANDPTAIATNETQIRGVWSDGTKIYWSSSLDGGSIRACVAANCIPGSVVSGIGAGVQILGVESGTLAWISDNKARACLVNDCATPKILGDANNKLTIFGGNAYWFTSQRTVVSCPALTGCDAPLVIGSSQSPAALVTDGNHLYWRDEFYDTIYRCQSSGCGVSPEIWATKQAGQPGGQLRVDGNYLYWTTTSEVHRVAK